MDIKKSNSSVQLMVAIIGATAICAAAIISILQPLVSRWVDNTYPTNTPLASISLTSEMPNSIPNNSLTESYVLPLVPIGTAQLIASQKVDSQLTGGGVEQSYSKDLNDGEIIVGHSSNVSFAKGDYQKDHWAVSFLIVGPGHFEFQVYSGLWDKWKGVSQDRYKPLLQEQFNVPVLRDSVACSKITIVCIGQEGYIDCPIIECP